MYRATFATGVLLATLVGTHFFAAQGGMLPREVLMSVGVHPAELLSRPHALVTAQLFHLNARHLLLNAVVIGMAMPFALRGVGVAQGLLASLLATPLIGLLLGLVVLGLALLNVANGDSAASRYMVGASGIALVGVGLALASCAGRDWLGVMMATLALALFFLIGAAAPGLALASPYLFAFHALALAYGLWLGRLLPWPASARRRAPRTSL